MRPSLALAFAGILGLAGVAPAQEPAEPPFRPSNEQIDETLDRTLEREYDEDHPPPPDGMDGGEAPPPPVVHVHDDDDDDDWLRLGGYAAHLYSAVRDVRVSRRQGSGNLLAQPIRLDQDEQLAEFDPEHAQTYRAWIDFGKHISIAGGYRRNVFRSQQAAGLGFTFDGLSVQPGEQLGVSIDTVTADLDLIIKPINNRWVSLDLHLGSRYVFWRTEMQGNQPNRFGRSTVEGAVPVVGAAIAVRPLRFLELFVRGRVGYLSYDRPESTSYHHGEVDHVSAKQKRVKTAEVDIGVQVLIHETIGVIAGWRMDYLEFERETARTYEETRGTVYGLYAGVVLQF